MLIVSFVLKSFAGESSGLKLQLVICPAACLSPKVPQLQNSSVATEAVSVSFQISLVNGSTVNHLHRLWILG